MKREMTIFCLLVICCTFIFSGCVTAPTTETVMIVTATVTNPPAPTATMEEPTITPEPTPTPEPPVPCMIAFDSDRDKNLEVYIMGPDGSGQTNLTNNGADDSDPVWSPDGSQIAFVSNRESELGGGQFIYVMAADGSNLRQLSQQPDSKMPDWSPDDSRIAFSHQGDIYVINVNGSDEKNLTNSPEKDEQPKFSPDGKRIAWIKGTENDTTIYSMNVDGSDAQAITTVGRINDIEWTVDGRIFTHWENPAGICFNCVVSADGKDVIDAGGKGTIQEFLPFWTLDGQRVEMGFGPISMGGNDEEVFLVSESFPDMFLNLTNNEANDRNADIPATCGPVLEGPAENQEQEQPQAAAPAANGDMVIGYVAGGENSRKENDILKACSELQIECIKGENIGQLAGQNVSAIVAVSNRWDALGSFPVVLDTVGKQIPVFIVDAETGVQGAYNLSVDSASVQASLEWMFKQMDDNGELVYFNFGNNGYHQELIDDFLAKNPGIKSTSLPADFNGNSYNEQSIGQLVKEKPKLGAIWSDGDLNSIFWGLNNIKDGSALPVTVCPARQDFLQSWKEVIDLGSSFECISTIAPGGAAYEGVYVAYYVLSGASIDPEMLGGYYGNTLKYDFPIITNENLEEWLGKVDSLQRGDWESLEIPPMTPEEIRETWFLE